MAAEIVVATARRRVTILAALLFLFSAATPAMAFDFSGWSAVLKKNTRPANFEGIAYTGFDYAAVRHSPEFGAILKELATFPPSELGGRDETLAFWINVYNIFAVKLVLDHYPVGSIKDAGSIFSPAWVVKAGTVGGKEYSLDEIEHKILRPIKEPAIHFAIVCASVSCPDLRPEAYAAAELKGQLKSQIRRFLINGGKGMRVERESKTVRLSKIFEWYGDDFAPAGGAVEFINRELGGAWNVPFGYSIEYLPYRWDLNTVR